MILFFFLKVLASVCRSHRSAFSAVHGQNRLLRLEAWSSFSIGWFECQRMGVMSLARRTKEGMRAGGAARATVEWQVRGGEAASQADIVQ